MPIAPTRNATPAIKSVTSADIAGPWVSAAGHTITITALGDVTVPDYGYSGPSANAAPFNQKTVTRHFGFGSQGTVTIGGVPVTVSAWSDTSITGTVNLTGTVNAAAVSVPKCAVQQQAQYGGSTAYCGQLVIISGNGKQSIDAVTVTIGGKKPTLVTGTIQSAIDAALPGDMLIVPPGTYNEMLIMWKPVRLQGVGATTSILNANAHPAGQLLDPWRRHVNCLFGLTMQGVPMDAGHPFDPTGTYSCPDTGWNPTTWSAGPNNPQVDRLPLEAVVGWDATLNGNLAELTARARSLLGAYEGAGITIVSKGLDFHGAVPWNDGTENGAFPTVTTLLTGAGPNPNALPTGDSNPLCVDGSGGANRFPSNFMCNPSSVDGITITNSSQGGGGMFIHGWAHNLQVANNRIFNNAGTLSGGISVGQGEFGTPYIVGGATNAAPGSCSDGTGLVTNQHEPYCFDLNVNVHNNAITDNSSTGDELFSATLAGGGGTTFCTGSDYYKFDYNWICGNMSSGEGGGVLQLGFAYNGDIEHNSIIFNQATNPTIPTNGGGVMIQGTPDTDPVCGSVPDQDCPPGLSDGTGPGLTINANLIQGNAADSGSGGGIRMQQVNGTDVSTFATQPNLWYSVNVTNNIITNNVAGWDGAGVSLQDALVVNLANNTIASNDSTASSGVLASSIGAPLSSAPNGNCVQNGPTGPTTASCPQPSGLVSVPNSSLLTTTFTTVTLTCPAGHYAPGTSATNGSCRGTSYPALNNDLFWQNRSFQIGISGPGTGTLNQQNLVSLYNASFSSTGTGTVPGSQTATGSCPAGSSYWDIGVRGDTGPSNHASGYTLNPTYSVLTDVADYSAGSAHNIGSNPNVVSQYCNGGRVPPECTTATGCVSSTGWAVPPGIADALSPNPVFSLTPAATVDEGNNWINMSWGPLSLTNPAVQGTDGNWGGGALLGNYALQNGSPAIDYVPVSQTHPTTDFFGNPRPDPALPGKFDVGAIENQAAGTPLPALTSITPNSGTAGASVNVTFAGTNLTGATWSTANTTTYPNITVTGLTVVNPTTVTATINLGVGTTVGAKSFSLTTPGGTSNTVAFNVVASPVPTLVSIAPASGLPGASANVTLTGTNLTGATWSAANSTTYPNITVTGFTVVNATTITATLNIGATTTVGAKNFSVTTPGGTSNTVSFTVTAAAKPALTSIAPASGVRGGSVNVTLTGTNLTGATWSAANTTGYPNITVTGFTVVNATTVTATLNIGATTTLGPKNFSVTGPGGTSNTVAFTVKGATVAFSGPTPALTAATVTPKVGTITVSNAAAATGPLTMTAAPTITRTAGSGTFSITGGTCASSSVVNPGGSCTVIVQYTPPLVGNRTAFSTAHITITGSGLAAATLNSPNFSGR